MEFRPHQPSDASEIEDLFVSVFSRSEGEAEGALIGNLAKDLIASTDSQDLYGFVAADGEPVVGAIFFSRLTFEQDVEVFILAPVAVHNDHQGRGIGQALITHGLREMKKIGVRLAITYGDPNFYSKVGFKPLSPEKVAPPLELSRPEGWLGQSLTDEAIEAIPGSCSCVKALDNSAYW